MAGDNVRLEFIIIISIDFKVESKVGVFYSAYNINLCAIRYLSYPSTIKPTKNSATRVRFPKVTVCNNVSNGGNDVTLMLRYNKNMHSRKKVRQFYPWIADALPALYANPVRNATDGREVDRNSKFE